MPYLGKTCHLGFFSAPNCGKSVVRLHDKLITAGLWQVKWWEEDWKKILWTFGGEPFRHLLWKWRKIHPKKSCRVSAKRSANYESCMDTFEVKRLKTATQFLATLPSFSENPWAHLSMGANTLTYLSIQEFLATLPHANTIIVDWSCRIFLSYLMIIFTARNSE